jgi:hypothetical protein
MILAFCTSIGIVLVFLTEIEEHAQMNGTVTMISAPTLSKVPTTVTSDIIVLDGSISPSIAIASDMPPVGAVSPSGIAIFAWKATS